MTQRRYHHGQLRAALVTHALAIADDSGEVSLREVARRAGVSHAAPYRHFKDLSALVAAAGREVAAELAERLEATATADLVQLFAIVIGYAQEHAGRFRLFAGSTDAGGDCRRVLSVFERSLSQERALVAWSCAVGLGVLSARGPLGLPAAELARSGAGLFSA